MILLLLLHPSKYAAILIPSNNPKARLESVLVRAPQNQTQRLEEMSKSDSIPEQVPFIRPFPKAENFFKALSANDQAIHTLEKFVKAIILIRGIGIKFLQPIDLSIISSNETI